MRKRVLVVITLTMLVMLIIIGAGTRLIVLDKFSDLERSYMARNVERFKSALADDLEAMSRTLRDWAEWDETAAFVRGRDRGYAERNAQDNRVFSNLRINLMLFADASGRTVYKKAVDIAADREVPFPNGLEEYLAAHPSLIADAVFDVSGIVLLSEGPLLICIRSVLDNRGNAPGQGFLLMGRFLDSAELLRLSHRIRLSVTVAPSPMPAGGPEGRREAPRPAGGGAQTPEDFKDAAALISKDRPTAVRHLNRTTVAGYAFLRDVAGDQVLMARVEAPRDIDWEGMRAILYFTFWLVFVGVSFSAAVLIFLEKAVISRMHDLSADVLTIGTKNDLSLRVAHSGTDEIAYLGAAINGMLEALEKSTGELRESEARNEALLSAVPDIILRISRDGALIDFRRTANAPFRRLSDDVKGRNIREIHGGFPSVPSEAVEWALNTAAVSAPGDAPSIFEFRSKEDGAPRWLEARAVCSGDNETVFFIRDVTAEKSLEEAQRKGIMLKEIHHRVKNNLQVISSLLDLQARASKDERTAAVLRESRTRLHSMSLIHEKLYRSGDSSGIPVPEYVRDLIANLRKSFAVDSETVKLTVDAEDVSLDMDVAVPCGLIINELVSNALKYAFPRGRKGEVRIDFHRGEGRLFALRVSDNGVGMPPEVDARAPATLGLRIVNVLAGQLKGALEVERNGGTALTVTFPEP